MHLSQCAQLISSGALKPVDIAIVEALAITEDGDIIPTTAVGNTHLSDSGKESYRGAEHAEATGTGGHGRYHHGSKSSQQNAYQYLQGI